MTTAVAGYDPFSPEVMEDPYPYYAWLREEAPCHHVPERFIHVVSRYDDVVSVLRDHTRFSSTQGVGYERRPVPMMIAYDPPDHTRLRRLVAKQFTPREIARYGARIRSIVRDLVDGMLQAKSVDLVDALATPLPTTVIAELMGVPPSDRADFKRWSDNTLDALGGASTGPERDQIEQSILEFAMYFHEVVGRRMEQPAEGADDLITLICGPTKDGDRLSLPEIVSFCILLLVAGNETTTNLIGNGALALLRHPDQWRRVREDRSLVPALVEETLRYDAPIQGFFRTPNEDVELAGVTIPAGHKTLVLYGSANRDASHFPDPDVFDVGRQPTDHVAFGSGVHVCLGAPLARLEARLVVEELLDRVVGVELEGEPVRTRNPLLRGVAELPVTVTPR